MTFDAPQSPDYLESEGPAPATGNAKRGLLVGAGVALVVAGGAAAWGVSSFLGGGSTPAEVLPADTIAFIAVDVDPGGGQQIEAYQTIKKFPSITNEVDIKGEGDLKESLVQQLLEEGECDNLTYAEDFESWLGSSVAMAIRPSSNAEPVPFAVIESGNEQEARDTVAKLAECSGDEVGAGYVDGFLVVAEDRGAADAVVAASEEGRLADSEEFQARLSEAGGDGFVTGYLSSDGLRAALDDTGGLGLTSGDAEAISEFAGQFKDFEGAAMSLRFEDGGVELKGVYQGLPEGLETSSAGASALANLPETTAAALSFAVSPTAVENLAGTVSGDVGGEEENLAMFEQVFGFSVAEAQALLGESVTLALDGDIDVDALEAGGPESVPAGLRIAGDPAVIQPLVERLIITLFGVSPKQVSIISGDDAVIVAFNKGYADKLAAQGELGDNPDFDETLPDLSSEAFGLYVNFNVGDWVSQLSAEADAPQELRDSLEALKTLGISAGTEGDRAELNVGLTTD